MSADAAALGGTGDGMSPLTQELGGTGDGISLAATVLGGTGEGMSLLALARGAPIKIAAPTHSNVAFADFTFFLLVKNEFSGG